jgi:DNA polymerase V
MPTLVNAVYEPLFSTKQKRPLFLVPVPAGFPSPADDYLEGALDLNEYLVKHKAATFFWRVTGS